MLHADCFVLGIINNRLFLKSPFKYYLLTIPHLVILIPKTIHLKNILP